MTLPTYLEPITELDAVNEMLATIVESPVTTLDEATSVDAAIARNTLRSMNRNVQSRGWHFNTEKEVTLALDADSKVPLPANTMRVKSSGTSGHLDVVDRAGFLYDRKDHTFIFDTSVVVDYVLLLPFEEIPQIARTFIYVSASRLFANRNLGGQQNVNSFTREDELKALSALKNSDATTGKYNILNGSNATGRVLRRDGYFWGGF